MASNLSEGAKLLYALILDFAWQSDHAWPGQERMAALLGKNARTIRRHLQELVAARLIGIEHRWTGKSQPQNIYHILNLSRAVLPSSEAKAGGQSPGQKCPGDTSKGGLIIPSGGNNVSPGQRCPGVPRTKVSAEADSVEQTDADKMQQPQPKVALPPGAVVVRNASHAERKPTTKPSGEPEGISDQEVRPPISIRIVRRYAVAFQGLGAQIRESLVRRWLREEGPNRVELVLDVR